MKIFDTFPLGSGPGDLDLLECRLYELDQLPGGSPVFRHVIVEGDVTFTNQPKPMYYLLSRGRFDKWADRIRYVPIHPVTTVPGKDEGDAWAREHCTRQATMVGLMDAEPGDLVLHGDCDEILSAEAWQFIGDAREWLADRDGPLWLSPAKMALTHYSYSIGWRQPWDWPAPSIARFDRMPASFTGLREMGWRTLYLPSSRPAGWHLSWLGGPDAIEVKVRSFSHTEVVDLVLGNVDRFWHRGEFVGGGPDGVHRDWYQMDAVEVDDTYPAWIRDGLHPASWERPRTYR